MEVNDILTNEFHIRYDAQGERLLLFRIIEGVPSEDPIELRLTTLVEMGSDNASKWLGETLLLLIPEMRKKLFNISD